MGKSAMPTTLADALDQLGETRAELLALVGALGEAGVTRCLQIIGNELDLTMAFCGLRRVQDIDQKILLPGSY